MSNGQITFKMTLNLDENWASHLSKDELVEYLKARLNSSLGFRGQIRGCIAGRNDTPYDQRRQYYDYTDQDAKPHRNVVHLLLLLIESVRSDRVRGQGSQ